MPKKIYAIELVELVITKIIATSSANKKSLAELLSTKQEQIMSIKEASSKIHKPKIYKNIINKPIHGCY